MKLATDQITEKEMEVIIRELTRVLKSEVTGDVVEMGCYEGGSAVEIQRYLRKHAPDRTLWIYDSFEGMPEKTKEDESPRGLNIRGGELKAAVSRLKRNFVKKGLPLPEIRRAWFYELRADDLPDQIAYAFLDGGLYESIMDSLKLIWPKMSSGGKVIIDDYNNSGLPGVALAVDRFTADQNVTKKLEKSLMILTLE